jgi:hypothetical protein
MRLLYLQAHFHRTSLLLCVLYPGYIVLCSSNLHLPNLAYDLFTWCIGCCTYAPSFVSFSPLVIYTSIPCLLPHSFPSVDILTLTYPAYAYVKLHRMDSIMLESETASNVLQLTR